MASGGNLEQQLIRESRRLLSALVEEMGQGNRWQLNSWIAAPCSSSCCLTLKLLLASATSISAEVQYFPMQCQDFQLRTVAHLLTPCFKSFLSSVVKWKTCFSYLVQYPRVLKSPTSFFGCMKDCDTLPGVESWCANFKFKWYSVQRIQDSFPKCSHLPFWGLQRDTQNITRLPMTHQRFSANLINGLRFGFWLILWWCSLKNQL